MASAVKKMKLQRLVAVEPGEWRVRATLLEESDRLGVELELRTDRHFICIMGEFAEYPQGRKQLRLEYFYRELRRTHGILMNGQEPEGGKWNYDQDNRGGFGKRRPSQLPSPKRFQPDATTKEVTKLVNQRFSGHPGNVHHFEWPVTHRQAHQALDDFI